MDAWHDWYHISGHTYGTWLPGNSKGWHTRRARGFGPASTSVQLEPQARALMPRAEVRLSPAARKLARQTMVEALLHHNIELIASAVGSDHFHILARFPDHQPRTWIGIAKKRSARALSDANLAPKGGVWAARCHCKPIRDREHQLQVARYIEDHAAEDAAVWFMGRVSPIS